jgi:hypothetical protein
VTAVIISRVSIDFLNITSPFSTGRFFLPGRRPILNEKMAAGQPAFHEDGTYVCCCEYYNYHAKG